MTVTVERFVELSRNALREVGANVEWIMLDDGTIRLYPHDPRPYKATLLTTLRLAGPEEPVRCERCVQEFTAALDSGGDPTVFDLCSPVGYLLATNLESCDRWPKPRWP